MRENGGKFNHGMEWDSRVAWHGAIDGFWPAKVIRQWVIDKLPNDQAHGIGCSKGAEIFGEVVTSQSWICWLFVVRKMGDVSKSLPSGNLIKFTIYSGFSHWKWWFSIVMLVYQVIKHHGISNWWTNGPWFSAPSGRSPPNVSQGVHRQCPDFEQLASMASDDWPSDSGPKFSDGTRWRFADAIGSFLGGIHGYPTMAMSETFSQVQISETWMPQANKWIRNSKGEKLLVLRLSQIPGLHDALLQNQRWLMIGRLLMLLTYSWWFWGF